MKCYIAALLIGVGVTIRFISCHGRNPRALKLKPIKKKKGKSSKRMVKKKFIPITVDGIVVNTSHDDLAVRDDVFIKKDSLLDDDDDVVVNTSSFSSGEQSNYIGCYKDMHGRNRDMEYSGEGYGIKSCKAKCKFLKKRFAGLQFYNQCFCSNSYGSHGKAPESECSYPCTVGGGNCGAAYRNSVYNTEFPACNEKSDCMGHGDDRSNGCWRGECTMCMPSRLYAIDEPCYCAKNGGGDSDFNVYVKIREYGDIGKIGDVSLYPPFGGQFDDRCKECRNRLEKDGVIATGATCYSYFPYNQIEMQKVSLHHLWKNFGPPDSGDIRRDPKDCRVGYKCNLFCGKHKGNQMHIYYEPNSSDMVNGLKVYGLDNINGDWMNGCNACASNLEDAKFIESGWECYQIGPIGVYMYNLKFKAGTRY